MQGALKPMTQDSRLGLVLAINLAMVAGLVVVGILSHSLGVLASGADYLGDAAGAALGLAALQIRRRRQGSRATSYAALANASFLLVVTLAVAIGAIDRLANGSPTVHGGPVIAISLVAALAMVTCAVILGDVEGDLSMRSVMLDTVADAAAAIGVAVSGAVILLTGGNFWLDSVFALVIAVAVAYHAIKLLAEVLADLGLTHRFGR